MPEPSLELLQTLMERVLVELREMAATLERIERITERLERALEP